MSTPRNDFNQAFAAIFGFVPRTVADNQPIPGRDDLSDDLPEVERPAWPVSQTEEE